MIECGGNQMVVVSHNTIHYTVWKPKLDAIVSALTR